MEKERIEIIKRFAEERRNEEGIKILIRSRDIELSDFGKYTKFC